MERDLDSELLIAVRSIGCEEKVFVSRRLIERARQEIIRLRNLNPPGFGNLPSRKIDK